MENSKLIRVLKVMSEEELKLLEKFIASPFFNESKTLITFYAYLRKLSPTWESAKLDREKVWKKLFPKEPYNDVRFRRFVSNLFQLVEKFIHHHCELSENQEFSNHLHFYYRRYLHKEYKDTLKTWEEKHLLQTEKSENYYKYLQEIEMHKSLIRFDNAAQQISNDFLSDFVRATDVHFIVVQLKWHCVTVNQTRNMKCNYTSPFLEKMLSEIENSAYLREIPVIHIHYLVYKIITEPNLVECYDALVEYMQEYPRFLTQDEWAYVSGYMRNYCTLQTHQKNKIFIQKLHDLHIFQLEKGLIFSYNILSSPIFRNIISIALLLKEYDWMRNFIPKYQNYLPKEEAENLVNFAFSRLYFEEKKYQECANYLNLMEKSNDRLLEVQARLLRLKMYYEQGEFDILGTMVETLKVFIFREQSFSEYYKMRYKNFTNFLLRMCNTSDFEINKWQRLRKDLADFPDTEIMQKEWLLEKILEKCEGE
jgi:hypothetical protein